MNLIPNYSQSSQELFRELDEIITDSYENVKCYYATSTKTFGEYRVYLNGHFRSLDFYIPEWKFCIEFDEKYHESKDQIQLDRLRENEIVNKVDGIEIFRISENSFLQNPDTIIEVCISKFDDKHKEYSNGSNDYK